MRGKKAALLWSTIHSIGDSLEEKVLLTFNEAQYLFWVNFMIGIFVCLFSLFGSIEISIFSFFILILYAFAMVGGDFCYAKAIQTLPIGLANLIDSGSLFLILLCDIFLGYIEPKLIFLILFGIFFVAIPMYYFLYRKEQKKKGIAPLKKQEKKTFFGNIVLLGLIYATTSILSTLAYESGTPVIITLLMKLQLFIVVVISVIRKTDKMNLKKIISLLVGITCIVLMTFMS